MQPLNHTEAFLAEVKSTVEWRAMNPDKDLPCNPCCIGLARVNDMLSEVEEAQLALEQRTSRDWAIGTPNKASVDAAKARIKLDCISSSGNLHSPRSVTRYNDKFYVASYYGVGVYDSDLNYEGKWGSYGSSVTATSDTYDSYIGSISFNPDGRVMLAMQGHHIVRVFSGNKKRLFDIGVFDSAGYCDQGKLYNPISALWLPNGNIIVCACNGNDTSATSNEGHVSIYNGQTGAYIKTLFRGKADGNLQMGQGYVYNPYGLRIIGNRLYIMDYTHQRVGVLDATTLELLDVINPMPELSQYGLNFNVMGVALDAKKNELIFAGWGFNGLLAIDASTYKYKWHVKTTPTDWRSANQYHNPSWVEVLDNGDLLVTDWSFHRIMRTPASTSLPITYDAAFGSQYQIEPTALPQGYSVQAGTVVCNVDLDKLNNIPNLVVPLVGR